MLKELGTLLAATEFCFLFELRTQKNIQFTENFDAHNVWNTRKVITMCIKKCVSECGGITMAITHILIEDALEELLK